MTELELEDLVDRISDDELTQLWERGGVFGDQDDSDCDPYEFRRELKALLKAKVGAN